MPADLTSHPLLVALLRTVQRRGCPAWFVGGTVRDRELGRLSPDIDVVVEADVFSLAAEVAAAAGRPWFSLSHEFGACRVVGDQGSLDLTALRGGDLSADLALRDFTVNAMALPVLGGPLIDPFAGRQDLRERRLRAVSTHAFADDPLRLLRAARFVHVLGFSLEPATERQVRAEASRMTSVAAERVLNEIGLTLDAGRSAAAFCLWSDLGLLDVMLPEVGRLRGLVQSRYHHLDALAHTFEAAARLDEILELPGRFFPAVWEPLTARLADPVDGTLSRPAALRLAALLHDVGKPDTRTEDPQGRILFWGHTELGARLAGDICRRLRCSSALISLMVTIVREHLALGVLERRDAPTARDTVRYFWSTAPWEAEAVMLSLADRLATRGPMVKDEQVQAQTRLAAELMAGWWRRQQHPVELPVNGDDLTAELGLAPGPLLGEVLREVRLACEAGEAQTRAQALLVAREYLGQRRRFSAD